MDTISNNISQVASVRTVTSLNYIKKTYNVSQKEINSFSKQISEESKNNIVSEQQDKYSVPASYNYQYQQGVPVSLLSTAERAYNETTKPSPKKETPSAEDESESSDYYVEETADKKQNSGLGYYIIDQKMSSTLGEKTAKIINPMRDRLNKIYNLNFGIEPGTIVNVTCY